MTDSDQVLGNREPVLMREPPAAKPPKPPKIWGFWATAGWGVGAFLVLAASQFGALLVYVAWLRHADPNAHIDVRNIGNDGPLVAIVTVVSLPVLLLYLAWAVQRSRTAIADYLGLRWPSRREALIALAGLVVVLAFESAAATFAGKDTPSFMTDTFATGRAAGLLPLLVLAFAVAAPAAEETLFRGFLYRGFAQSLGVPAAIILTATLWAAMHIQYDWFFVGEILVLGIFLGWVRHRSGSILLTIGLHAAVNSVALIGLAIGQ